MPQIALSEHPRTNPLDVVERIAAINDWSFERAGDDEITMLVGGKWSDYQVSFTWMHDIEALHLACAFDLKVPERRRSEVQQLIKEYKKEEKAQMQDDSKHRIKIFFRKGEKR